MEVFLVQGRNIAVATCRITSMSDNCSSVAPLAGEDGSPEEEGEDGVTRRSKGQGS